MTTCSPGPSPRPSPHSACVPISLRTGGERGGVPGRPGRDVYRRFDDRATVLVPASTRFADYPVRLLQLAETVGRTEDRRPSAVLADLSLAAVDLIRVRLPGAHDDHSLALDAGVDLLSGSRKLVFAAACSTVRPQRRFRQGATTGPRRTSPASGWDIPSRAASSSTCGFPYPRRCGAGAGPLFAPPFERRANRTLVAGLRAAREATDLITGETAFEPSINECGTGQCEPVHRRRRADRSRWRTGSIRSTGWEPRTSRCPSSETLANLRSRQPAAGMTADGLQPLAQLNLVRYARFEQANEEPEDAMTIDQLARRQRSQGRSPVNSTHALVFARASAKLSGSDNSRHVAGTPSPSDAGAVEHLPLRPRFRNSSPTPKGLSSRS